MAEVEEKNLTKDDFRVLGKLGNGAYGRVVKAEKIDSGEIFAVKIVQKQFLAKENKTKQALAEKVILTKLRDHPGIVTLYYTFHDESNLYYVEEFCSGGELLKKIILFGGVFPMELARFYTAQLVSALEFMHTHNICHRDLKPENVLLSENGQLRIVDFGTAKDLSVE
jgi:serine/threonine protein kinase